ncbi:chorismate transformation enzyme, FkbO/Hyg5 family [Massilibacteroides vaginae]|uniref:chorismate transformation enzyme, FkbO/Hyg5 family n=1 Tax=Massilibacteroides vaginae TaxID=1673718 RepID=UPI000A1CD773|nr:endoribonuclease L-PSP [Massilibacteroides vaginae]
MSYCNNIKYNLLTTVKDDFPTMVDHLLAQLPSDETIVRLAFFGTPANNEEYLKRRSVLCEKIDQKFGVNKPALSYVSQPPLNAPLLVEVHSYQANKEDRIIYGIHNDLSYVIIENETGRFLYAGGFQGDVAGSGVEQQSVEVLKLVNELLEKEGFPINSIVRQWNYIEQITAFDGHNQHYQSFNNARAVFYKKTNWPLGYPAATGIGANLGGVLIDFDAVLLHKPEDKIKPIDNKLQVAAHAYSEEVLKKASDKKETPKFERAKSLTISGKELIYVSGTAAIRGEESLENVGVVKQLHITMENIAELTGVAKLLMLRVYLKYKEDFSVTESLLRNMYPDLPVSYMCADVCRDELLIEIEGVAVKDN